MARRNSGGDTAAVRRRRRADDSASWDARAAKHADPDHGRARQFERHPGRARTKPDGLEARPGGVQIAALADRSQSGALDDPQRVRAGVESGQLPGIRHTSARLEELVSRQQCADGHRLDPRRHDQVVVRFPRGHRHPGRVQVAPERHPHKTGVGPRAVRGVERRRRADGADAFVRFLQQGRIDQRADLPQRRVERQTPGSRLARGLAASALARRASSARPRASSSRHRSIKTRATAPVPWRRASAPATSRSRRSGGGVASGAGEDVRPPRPLQLLGHGRRERRQTRCSACRRACERNLRMILIARKALGGREHNRS
jgi:hypothetical protein